MRQHRVPLHEAIPRLSALRGLHFTAAQHHMLNIALFTPFFAMPILANVILGSEQAAYLYATWQLAGFLFYVPIALATALFASGSRDSGTFLMEFRFTLRAALAICLASNLGVLLLGQWVLLQVDAGACAAAAPHFLDGPVQAGLDGGGGRVDVVAIQAQAGLQPQRVARAQADGLDLGLGQQGAGQGVGLCGGHRHFKTVFAGVAAAGHKAVAVCNAERATGHEHQLFDTGRQAGEGGDGLWALQREQRVVGHGHHLAALADAGLDVGDVTHLACAVDDDE